MQYLTEMSQDLTEEAIRWPWHGYPNGNFRGYGSYSGASVIFPIDSNIVEIDVYIGWKQGQGRHQ